MPSVDTLDDLKQAVAAYDPDHFELSAEPAALDRARKSLDETGLLLLGEVHGVRENPLIILGLMRLLGLTGLALEWDEGLGPSLDAYLADGTGLDHGLWWLGDGRVTAGHLAVFRRIAGLRVTLFDGPVSITDGSERDAWPEQDARSEQDAWSERDAAMARRVLAAGVEPALVVAGNAHTPTTPTDLGIPLGAWLARERPGLASVRIDYGTGSFYNGEPRRMNGTSGVAAGLRMAGDELVVGLPEFGEAVVPHLPFERLRVLLGW